MDAPLILTPEITEALHALRRLAATKPVDVRMLLQEIKTPLGEHMHLERMQKQTTVIYGPWPFFVTFSIETGHPVGTCRHMSMSIKRGGRVPNRFAIWIVAEELGFVGGLKTCNVWPEELRDGGIAVNVVQPLAVNAG